MPFDSDSPIWLAEDSSDWRDLPEVADRDHRITSGDCDAPAFAEDDVLFSVGLRQAIDVIAG